MSTQPQSRSNLESHVLSPDEIAHELNGTLRFQQEEKLLRVAGVFRDLKKEKVYGVCVYDALLDPVTRHSLTLLVPVDLKGRLRDGRAYAFRGYLRRKVSGGRLGIDVEFRVTGVEKIDLPSYEEILVKRSDAFHAKCSRGFKRVEGVILERLRNGGPVRVALIHGVDAVVDRDVLDGLKRLPNCYEIEWKGVSLRNTSAIISALKGLDARGDYDLIGVIRGGGELDVFDDPEIALAAAELGTPFVTAIGHTVDRSLCDQVADKEFGTPAALGVFLAKMAEVAKKEFAVERRLGERGRSLAAKEAALTRKEADLSGRESRLLQKLTEERGDPDAVRPQIPRQPGPPDRTAKILYLAAGVIVGVFIGIIIAHGVRWQGAGGESERNQNQVVQPAPVAQPTPSPSPATDGRRKRRGSSN